MGLVFNISIMAAVLFVFWILFCSFFFIFLNELVWLNCLIVITSYCFFSFFVFFALHILLPVVTSHVHPQCCQSPLTSTRRIGLTTSVNSHNNVLLSSVKVSPSPLRPAIEALERCLALRPLKANNDCNSISGVTAMPGGPSSLQHQRSAAATPVLQKLTAVSLWSQPAMSRTSEAFQKQSDTGNDYKLLVD